MADEDILKTFEAVGIPRTQTLVYLDLLKNKESTATEISKRTKMHRANVYDTLTKLKERNLVYLSNKEGKQVFAALSTDLIINEEKDKLENLKIAMNYIKTTYVPGHTPKVYTLEGLNTANALVIPYCADSTCTTSTLGDTASVTSDVNTLAGTDVITNIVGGELGLPGGVSITFGTVVTGGVTSTTTSTSPLTGTAPSGFNILGNYFDIETNC